MNDSPSPQPSDSFVARLGKSGLLMGIGAVIGVISVFLPLVSMSVDMGGMMNFRGSAMVIDDWRGKAGIAGYIAAIVLTILLFPPQGRPKKELSAAAIGVGVAVALLALWLLAAALNSGGADLMGFGNARVGVGIGAIINLLAGAAVLAGAVLKAREERLF
jgi:hypothetical protein